ncbi:MAG: hypothetical protein FWG87_12455 [Defluviitaleaceae bacterium]|nr:hypothetical protein [Defluviitaleaceae bacterium]
MLIVIYGTRIWRIYADFKDIQHGFTRITRILSDLADFRGFSREPIRVIRENPLNPCLIYIFRLRAFVLYRLWEHLEN